MARYSLGSQNGRFGDLKIRWPNFSAVLDFNMSTNESSSSEGGYVLSILKIWKPLLFLLCYAILLQNFLI